MNKDPGGISHCEKFEPTLPRNDRKAQAHEKSLLDKRNTRQSKLSVAGNGDIGLITESDPDQLPDLIGSLKVDMNKNMTSINSQLTGLTTTIASLSSKMSDITDKCDQLVLENDLLKKSNSDLQNKVTNLEKAIDNIENQSRRSNLIFDGIEGEHNEP